MKLYCRPLSTSLAALYHTAFNEPYRNLGTEAEKLKLTKEETDKLKAKRQAELEAKLKAEKEYDLSEDEESEDEECEDEKESEKEINIMDWHAVDEEFSRYTIYGFGKDIKGKNYTF